MIAADVLRAVGIVVAVLILGLGIVAVLGEMFDFGMSVREFLKEQLDDLRDWRERRRNPSP